MLKKFLFTSFLILSSLVTLYPSKKENTNFFNYCYSLEKIISRNSVEKSKNLSKNFKSLAKDITLFGTKKTKGNLANKIIDQYKNSKKLFIISIVPNQIYCLAGYWIEEVNPGTFKLIIYEKSQQKINEYKDILARCLVIIITTLDPDAIVFGGGISNEIDFLDQIKKKTSSFINEPNLKTVFLKPKYGDASGVRGAAILSRQSFI